MKKNIIIGTNNFGLGPVGKVSSIITELKSDFNFYACGNNFDLNIFEKNTFKDILFTKDKDKIEEFVIKNKIKYGIVVLDVELSKILMSLNVKVIFVDSLPFMWTQADIDEELLPIDADYYCAQKCINLTEASKKVLEQIKNLKWINPIQNKPINNFKPFNNSYVHINVGGLHSPIGNGESYIKTVIFPILDVLDENDLNIIITCGTKAKETILRLIKEENLNYNNLKIDTLKQSDFLSSINNAKLFITSPGLTTIYETSSLNKGTILLPPQNLSQFYNIEYAKKILNKYKVLNWDTKKLNFDYLNDILPKGETYVVDKIYEYITELVDTDFKDKFREKFSNILEKEYEEKQKTSFKIDGNGAEDIKNILISLVEEKNEN